MAVCLHQFVTTTLPKSYALMMYSVVKNGCSDEPSADVPPTLIADVPDSLNPMSAPAPFTLTRLVSVCAGVVVASKSI